MKINREFTSENQSPYQNITFKKVSTEIRNPDGSVVFELKDDNGSVVEQPVSTLRGWVSKFQLISVAPVVCDTAVGLRKSVFAIHCYLIAFTSLESSSFWP